MTLFMKRFPLKTPKPRNYSYLKISNGNAADVSTGEAVATSTIYVRLMK